MSTRNLGSFPLFLAAGIRDGTGITNTVVAAITPAAILGALFLETEADATGSITFAPLTGQVTVSKSQGRGKYLVTVTSGGAQGPNASTHGISIFAVEGGATVAEKGNRATKLEPAAATVAGEGVCMAVCNLSAVGDTVEVRTRVGVDGNAIVYRDLSLTLQKIDD